MKKIFTLLLTTGIISFSFAQPGAYYPPKQSKPLVVVKTPVARTYEFTAKQRDRTIAKIHRRYERKIRQVNNRLFMSRYKKMDMTRQLERQRDIEIGRVNAKFYNNRNRAYHSGNYNRRRY